jgi:hypothetical protein
VRRRWRRQHDERTEAQRDCHARFARSGGPASNGLTGNGRHEASIFSHKASK